MDGISIRQNHGPFDCLCFPFKSIFNGLSHLFPDFSETFLGSIYYSIRNKLPIFPSQLRTSIRALANDMEKADFKPIITAFGSPEFARVRGDIHYIFGKCSDDQLNGILKELFKTYGMQNYQLLIQRLNGLLTLNKVECAVASQFPLFKAGPGKSSTAEAAKEMAEPAKKEVVEKAEAKRSKLILLAKYYTLSTLDWIFDTLRYVFLLKNVTDGDATRTERQMIASMQWTAFRENLALLVGWIIGLSLIVQSIVTAVVITAAICATVFALGAIYVKYFKPPPEELHPAANYHKLAIEERLPTVKFREEVIAEILNLFEQNAEQNDYRRFPILVGESRVGKSDIIKAVAQRFASGKDVPAALKNLYTYSVNASNLIDGNGTPEHWELILKNIEGHENQAFIFIDEIQAAFDTDERKVLGNLLLTALDTNGLPFMAFACTQKDFDAYIAPNEPFMNRVKVIHVRSLDEDQTLGVLSGEAKREDEKFYISKKVIKKVSELSKSSCFGDFRSAPQPATSKKIMGSARERVQARRSKLKSQLSQKLDIAATRNNGKSSPSYTSKGKEFYSHYYKQQEEIAALKKEIALQDRQIHHFEETRKVYRQLKETVKEQAIQISNGYLTSSQDQMKYLLMLNYLKPAMKNNIREQVVSLKGLVNITDADVESAIQTEAASIRHAQERAVRTDLSHANWSGDDEEFNLSRTMGSDDYNWK